jgi:hypothetical protein
MRFFGTSLTLAMLCLSYGCRGVVINTGGGPGPSQAPAEPDVEVVQEGATYGGIVVAEPPRVQEYVFIGGHWHYWAPRHSPLGMCALRPRMAPASWLPRNPDE